MPSAFSHAVAALAIAAPFYRPEVPKRVWIIGAVCSASPDIDIVGFLFGIHYGDFFGHRGFTHSLVFAALLAGVVSLFLRDHAKMRARTLLAYLFLAIASHGLLDMMTNGGLGIAYFSPFDNHRYFLPWTPIKVSPLIPARFFSARGFAILGNELLWVWVPSLAFASLVMVYRRTRPTDA